MTRRSFLPSATILLILLGLGVAASIAAEAPASAPSAPAAKPAAAAGANDHIVVQHILIGFEGSVPGKKITRTQAEAKALADEVLARAKKGEDFDKLVKEYTADSAPGIYGMANTGVTPGPSESLRGGMVKGFGDVSFSLKVGEIGMAEYDPATSKYGWHIIKRVK